MDESMNFFAVTKEKKPGVYCSWKGPNEKAVSCTFPEFHGFNSYDQALLAFNSKMSSIHAENSAKAEMVGSLCEGGGSSGGSRRRPIVSWLPVISQEELEWNFAIVNDMEE
ncbi:uncharacterized protein LOC110270986 [Arachis ipaensis]|uniref:uncharacterized protein LOC110266191 n=1 Tax=Arachis ipaensis TaxID=130454 RepID=UPI000A2B921F|nr:uncharacterized protein LOC110266191 [Arachis ipaensis]XP_020976674.1 uncharacterized protein LOC110270986 [Arachis ipaensis]XP_025644881.1 uncharacterized protein LOC112740340 [Arachis hypogaea]